MVVGYAALAESCLGGVSGILGLLRLPVRLPEPSRVVRGND